MIKSITFLLRPCELSEGINLSERSDLTALWKLNLSVSLWSLDLEELISGILDTAESKSVVDVVGLKVDLGASLSAKGSHGVGTFLAFSLPDEPVLSSFIAIFLNELDECLGADRSDRHESVGAAWSLGLYGIGVDNSFNLHKLPFVGESIVRSIRDEEEMVARGIKS